RPSAPSRRAAWRRRTRASRPSSRASPAAYTRPMAVRTIAWEGELPGHVVLLEQTRLPLEHVDVAVRSVEEMADAIARLAVRGAPAIGVAAAYGVVLGAQAASSLRGEEALARILSDCDRLAASRPTAVN